MTLQRNESTDEGTFGTIEHDGEMWRTGELPWRDNAPNVSCIPPGTYRVEWRRSSRFGECYHLRDVPGRSAILIHKGNYCGDKAAGFRSDVEGCILIGKSLGSFRMPDGGEQRVVVSSSVAIKEFEAAMGHEPFELEITQG